MSGNYGVSIGGECGNYGWVKSGGVGPLSQGVSVVLASLLDRSIGSISWGWVKSTLGNKSILELCPGVLVHLLDFMYFCLNLYAVVQAYKQVVAQLGVIRVRVARVRTGHRRDITVVIGIKLGFRSETSCLLCAV